MNTLGGRTMDKSFVLNDIVSIKKEAWERELPATVPRYETARRVMEVRNDGMIMLDWPFHWWRPEDLEHAAVTVGNSFSFPNEVTAYIEAGEHEACVARLEGDKANLLSTLENKQRRLEAVREALAQLVYYAEKAVETVDWPPGDLEALQAATHRGRDVLDGILGEEE